MEQSKSEYRKEYTVTAVILTVAFTAMMAVFGLMAYSLFRSPEVINMIYDKVTLPQSLQFMISLKGIFRIVMSMICCLPAAAILLIMELALSKYGNRYKE